MSVTAKAKIMRRLQVELPPRSAARLDRLKDLTEASSAAEVLRNALRVYEELASRTEQGDELMLRTKDGELVAFPLLL
jgi:Arc/MetJ-type ribon-helix-helix transcriptional regulator